jgi:hypothetical protein
LEFEDMHGSYTGFSDEISGKLSMPVPGYEEHMYFGRSLLE